MLNRLSNLLAALVVSASLLPVASAQFAQQGGKLIGSSAVGASNQGSGIALSDDGNTALVGGSMDNHSAGAAWVYTRSGDVWSQQGGKLAGTGAVGGAEQGYSVALSGDGNTAIVGGLDDSNDIGAAWVFTRSNGVWTQDGLKLSGVNAFGFPNQGNAVAISGDGNTAIVGGSNDNGIGAAWVFTRALGGWAPQGAKLVSIGAGLGSAFGSSVAMSNDGSTAIIGGALDNGGTGAAWVFTRTGSVWAQQGSKLVGTNALVPSTQGTSVALSQDGNTAIVGGANDNNGIGAVWVFTRSNGIWAQQGGKLIGTGYAGASSYQGTSVAMSGDGNTAIVGGSGDNTNIGAAWIFTRSSGVWKQQGSKLLGTGGVLAQQGTSVAMSGDGNTAIVGGSADNLSIGAAWVFARNPPVIAAPVITSMVNGASFNDGPVTSGSWVTIFGSGLAPASDSRTWNTSTEIVNGQLPLKLDGLSVTVNGKPAAVEYISPSQVNIQPPDDSTIGFVPVVVTTSTGSATALTSSYAQFAPGLFQATPPFLAAQHADNSYVTSASPAMPGEVIILWGTGFGPANPPVAAGEVFSGANALANPVTVMIGGQPAGVDFAGVVGAGLVQINVHVPSGIGNGNAAVVATVGGMPTQTVGNMIPVHN